MSSHLLVPAIGYGVHHRLCCFTFQDSTTEAIKMQWKKGIIALGLLAQGTAAQMIRFGCSQLVIARMDPLVNPGMAQSPHVHQIVGGNSFNISMDPANHDLVRDSTCTSCTFSEDFSNYWTAVLYFRARNGTYKRVRQFPNDGLRTDGGVTVYYIPPYDGKTKVTAFKPGFRMLVGDPSLRTPEGQQRQLCHRCGRDPGAPCAGKGDSQALPNRFCEGIRTTITFPTCWDGKNTDSPDHKSHVAYPSVGTFESTGECPASHPVRLPQVMYEVMWDVSVIDSNLCSVWLVANSSTRPPRSMTRHCGPRMAPNRFTGALATRTDTRNTETMFSAGRATVSKEL
jgi:hypothetical protein